jgi:hypothetical protein
LIFIRVFQSSSCRVFFKFPVDTTSLKKRLGLEAGRRRNRREDVGQRSPKNRKREFVVDVRQLLIVAMLSSHSSASESARLAALPSSASYSVNHCDPRTDSLERAIGQVKMFRFAEEPYWIDVEPEVRKLSRDYFNRCAAKARGTLCDVDSFALRWRERAWEIAINLHMGIYGVQWADHPARLSAATFSNALLITDFFAERQLEVLQRPRVEAQQKHRDRLEEVFENNKKEPMTLRTLRDRHGITKDEVILCVKSHPDVFGIITVDPPHGGSKSTLVFLKSNPPPGWRFKQ